MNVVITGGSGMVGSNFLKILSKKGYNLFSLYNSHATDFDFCENIKVDITDKDKVLELESLDPDIIINCAALTNIAYCHDHEEMAHKVNVEGTRNVAELAKKTGAKLVHLSTDSVFDGVKGDYKEEDETNPSTIYGKSKAKGEQEILRRDENSLIIRTNIFGKNNFEQRPTLVETILGRLERNEEFTGFTDAVFSPVYFRTLLEVIEALIKKDAKGIFNVSSSDYITKFEFARLLAKTFGHDEGLIVPISIESISKEIKYQKNLTLNNSKVNNILNTKLPVVEQMLKEFKKDQDLTA